MASDPILLMGGTGAIGQLSARALRTAHPDAALLIGGRDQAKAEAAAREIGGAAEGVAIDPRAPDLGLGERPIGALAVFYSDDRLAADLRQCARRAASRHFIGHLRDRAGSGDLHEPARCRADRPGL